MMAQRTWLQQFEQEYGEDPGYLAAGFMRQLVDEVCRRMDDLHLTQRELAARMGTSQAYVAKVLNHHPNMTVKSLMQLATALELQVDGISLVDKRTGRLFADTGEHRVRAIARTAVTPDWRPHRPLAGIGRGEWREQALTAPEGLDEFLAAA